MIIKHSIESGKPLLIPSYLVATLSSLGKGHLPNEFGGILTGYRRETYDIVIDFATPVKYRQNRGNFTRSPEQLNEYLQSIHTCSNGELEYLGEWHTHPFGSPEFSHQDLCSMREIANDKQVGFSTPYLLILGIADNSSNYNLFRFTENKLMKFSRKEVL